MKTRRSHYELAFEALLNQRGTPYVPVEDVTQFVRSRAGAKVFDYIVYPPGGTAYLVDVKGRRSEWNGDATEVRQKTWVTQGDLDGLAAWEASFGAGFEAAFVFAYWLDGPRDAPAVPGRKRGSSAVEPSAEGRNGLAEPPQEPLTQTGRLPNGTCQLAGRPYQFFLVRVEEYMRHQRPLSRRWKTVSVPRDAFRCISRPLDKLWLPAPC